MSSFMRPCVSGVTDASMDPFGGLVFLLSIRCLFWRKGQMRGVREPNLIHAVPLASRLQRLCGHAASRRDLHAHAHGSRQRPPCGCARAAVGSQEQSCGIIEKSIVRMIRLETTSTRTASDQATADCRVRGGESG